MGLRDILLLVVLAGLIPLAFFRPWTGVLTWAWLGLMNPHKLSWNVQQYPVAMAVAVATLTGLLFTQDRKSIPWTREMILLLLLAAHMTITTLFAWYPELAWLQWDKVMKILLFAAITPMLIYGRTRIRLFVLVIVFSLGFYGFKGGIFSIATGGQFKVWGPENSFIGDNNSIGLAMTMILPLVLEVAREEANKYLRWLLYATFWLTIPAILFTYSRGAFLALAVVLLALFWRYKARIFTLAAVVLLGGLLLQNFIPSAWFNRQETTLDYTEDNSAMQRIQAWSVSKNIALENPVTGAGFNFENGAVDGVWLSYADFLGDWNNSARAAHSIYFQVLGQHGFVGLFLFVALLLGTFFRLRSLGRMEYDADAAWIGRYAKGMQFSLIGYIIAGAFLSLAYFDLFYTYVALSAILTRESIRVRESVQDVRAEYLAHEGPHALDRN